MKSTLNLGLVMCSKCYMSRKKKEKKIKITSSALFLAKASGSADKPAVSHP